ncbi:hypothetical protein FRC11_002511, partial [Ceratobasidium sp. 423]
EEQQAQLLLIGEVNKHNLDIGTLAELGDSIKKNDHTNFHPCHVWGKPSIFNPSFLKEANKIKDLLTLEQGHEIPVCHYVWETDAYKVAIFKASFSISYRTGAECGYVLDRDEREEAFAEAAQIASGQPVATLGNGAHHTTAGCRNAMDYILQMQQAIKSRQWEEVESLRSKAIRAAKLDTATKAYLASNDQGINKQASPSEMAFLLANFCMTQEEEFVKANPALWDEEDKLFNMVGETSLSLMGDSHHHLPLLMHHHTLRQLMFHASAFDLVLDCYLSEDLVKIMASHENGGVVTALVMQSMAKACMIFNINADLYEPGDHWDHFKARFDDQPAVHSVVDDNLFLELLVPPPASQILPNLAHLALEPLFKEFAKAYQVEHPGLFAKKGVQTPERFPFPGFEPEDVTKDRSMWGRLYKFVVAKPKGVKPTFQTVTKQLLSKPTHLKHFDHHVQVLGVIFILLSHVYVNILQPHVMLPSKTFFSTVSTFITGGAKTKNKPAVPALPPAALAMVSNLMMPS